MCCDEVSPSWRLDRTFGLSNDFRSSKDLR